MLSGIKDGQHDTFTEREAITAYAWNSLLDCQAIANDIGQCKVVELFYTTPKV